MGFLNKYGIAIIILLGILIFFNTCGTKSKIDKLEKYVVTSQNAESSSDSINNLRNEILNEIHVLEVSKEVLYSWNSVVRTVNRPDDLMNSYDNKIKDWKDKLNQLNVNKK
jgi:hypothetical protein